jgi:hypothetical protein
MSEEIMKQKIEIESYSELIKEKDKTIINLKN